MAPKRTLISKFKRMLYIIAGMYLAIVVLLVVFENSLVYPAPRTERGDWEPLDLPYQDVDMVSPDGTRLHAWAIESGKGRQWLMYFHGNGEHIADNVSLFRMLHDKFNVNVLALDYRGYGKSDGSPNESGVLQDAEAAHDWLMQHADIQSDDIMLMGRSLGGGVAVHLAGKRGARALVLESTFASVPDAAANIYWWVPVRLLMRNRYNSEAKIANYTGPLLHSHGTDDRLIPLEHGQRLHEACPSQEKFFYRAAGCGHNSFQPTDYYTNHLVPFLDRHRIDLSSADDGEA